MSAPANLPKRNEAAIPEPLEPIKEPCCVCGDDVDLRKAAAILNRGKRVAHIDCYQGAWFVVGVADRLVGSEASS